MLHRVLVGGPKRGISEPCEFQVAFPVNQVFFPAVMMSATVCLKDDASGDEYIGATDVAERRLKLATQSPSQRDQSQNRFLSGLCPTVDKCAQTTQVRWDEPEDLRDIRVVDHSQMKCVIDRCDCQSRRLTADHLRESVNQADAVFIAPSRVAE